MTAIATTQDRTGNPTSSKLGWRRDRLTEEGRIKAARCGRSVGRELHGISTALRTLRRFAATCQFAHRVVLARPLTPFGDHDGR
jgi:hypothetical protein